MKINVNACTLENSRIYFLWYQENSHPENFHQSNPTLVNFPKKFPPGIGNLLPLSLILLKRMFYNSMFQKCWSLYACENLSKWSVKWRKKWVGNEIGGNIPGENFLDGNFPGGRFPGGSLMSGNFSGGKSPGRRGIVAQNFFPATFCFILVVSKWEVREKYKS